MNMLLIGLLCWALFSTVIGLMKVLAFAASAWRMVYLGAVAVGGVALLPQLPGAVNLVQGVQLPENLGAHLPQLISAASLLGS